MPFGSGPMRFRDGSCRYFGYGPGYGRGMGYGRGFAPGRGFDYYGPYAYDQEISPEMESQELKEYQAMLKRELEMIGEELKEVEKRLETLENTSSNEEEE
ncbi:MULTISPECIES: DUF5320 domain-containing protein [unclassified Mesotoga]|uniref:DUF5320 domain-containing protein n=1 Tax=unclassified Mesotoga TaxID=1184398 RepID=UPI000DA6976F|nr:MULTISPECIES: DUF5320 domain-containing protein [unclassified Mesotoga]PZC52566.1 hypothetical protein LH53_03540 [Mesotoga sp. TolDC]